MVKHGQTEGLPLSVCSKICLKTKWVYGGEKSFDCVQGWAWHWCILGNMTSGINKQYSKQELLSKEIQTVRSQYALVLNLLSVDLTLLLNSELPNKEKLKWIYTHVQWKHTTYKNDYIFLTT